MEPSNKKRKLNEVTFYFMEQRRIYIDERRKHIDECRKHIDEGIKQNEIDFKTLMDTLCDIHERICCKLCANQMEVDN